MTKALQPISQETTVGPALKAAVNVGAGAPLPADELATLILERAKAAGVSDDELIGEVGVDRDALVALALGTGTGIEPADLRMRAVAALDAWNHGRRVHMKQYQGPAPASGPAFAQAPASGPGPAATSAVAMPAKPKAPAINLAAIPPELQTGRFFVLWRFLLKKDKQGKLKWTKPPYQSNGQYASTTNPATWCTLAEAKAALAKFNPDGSAMFDGIGRVFSPDDPVQKFGFDLDGCIAPDANGVEKPTPEAQQAIEELACYAEHSPSGEGVQILGLGKLPGPHFTNNKLGREAYDSTKAGRYLTMTGQVLPGFETLRAPEPTTLAKWHGKWSTHAHPNQLSAATVAATGGPTGAGAGARTGTGTGGAAPPLAAANTQPIQFLANVALDSRGLPQDIIDLIRRQDGLDRHYNSDGSLAVYAACIEMARATFSDLEMLSVLSDPANALADVALRRRKRNRQSAGQWLMKYQLGKAQTSRGNPEEGYRGEGHR